MRDECPPYASITGRCCTAGCIGTVPHGTSTEAVICTALVTRQAEVTTKITLHNAYLVGIALKGLDGLLEIAGGTTLLLISRATLLQIAAFVSGSGSPDTPHGAIAAYVLHTTATLSAGTQQFASVYLLIHGIIKVGLVAGLLRKMHAAYPIALTLLTAFIGYQCYRLFRYHSLALGVFTAIDIAIVLLIWREWRSVTLRRA